MRSPTAYELELGRFLRSRFGADTKVVRFADDEHENDAFIVSGYDCPYEGVTSYGSVGLSNRDQFSGSLPVRVEILAACASSADFIDNLVASCVFDSLKNGTNIVYGAVIRDLAVQYNASSTLKHVTFVSPFLWNDLNKVDLSGKTIHFLLMLPISDAELDYLAECGIDALEKTFDEKQIDIFDINRPSAI